MPVREMLGENLEASPSPGAFLGKFEVPLEGSKPAPSLDKQPVVSDHSPAAQDLEASHEILINCHAMIPYKETAKEISSPTLLDKD